MHLQAGQCGNQIGAKVSAEEGPGAGGRPVGRKRWRQARVGWVGPGSAGRLRIAAPDQSARCTVLGAGSRGGGRHLGAPEKPALRCEPARPYWLRCMQSRAGLGWAGPGGPRGLHRIAGPGEGSAGPSGAEQGRVGLGRVGLGRAHPGRGRLLRTGRRDSARARPALFCPALPCPATISAVLGGDQRRTWHRPYWHLPRGQRPAAGADQRVLQRGHR